MPKEIYPNKNKNKILPIDGSPLPLIRHYDRTHQRHCNCEKDDCKLCKNRKCRMKYYIKYRIKLIARERMKKALAKNDESLLNKKMNEYFEKVKDQEYWDNVRIKNNGD